MTMARLANDERPTAEKTDRRDDDGGERDHEREDGHEREKQGDEVELHEASLFLLVEDDVERVDDRLHSGVGAPEGDDKSGHEAETEPGVAFRRDLRDLLVEDLDRAGGKNARGERKMRIDRRSVGDQAIERDEGGDGGEDRQERIKDDARRDGEQPVVVETRIDPAENVLPAPPGDSPGRGRAPPPALLPRPAPLRGNRLVVLELLPRPLVGIGRLSRGGVGGIAAVLILRGIDRAVWLADRPAAAAASGFVRVSPPRVAAIAAKAA